MVKSVNLSKQHDEKLQSVCKNSDSNNSFSNEQRQNVMPAGKTDFSITTFDWIVSSFNWKQKLPTLEANIDVS